MNGLAQVQGRVAEIQSRLAQLASPTPAAGFTLASTAGTTTAPAGPAAPAAAAPAAAGAAAAAPATGSTATGRVEGRGVDASALAARLPAAGRPWAGAITAAAERAGIDPAFLAAVVRHESNFDPAVRSHAGAIGLGQLMPGTAAALGVDPTDPQQNLDGAARYLREQLDRFGSPDLALAAYNAGPNRVAQAGGIPQITETRNYVPRVLATWEQYR